MEDLKDLKEKRHQTRMDINKILKRRKDVATDLIAAIIIILIFWIPRCKPIISFAQDTIRTIKESFEEPNEPEEPKHNKDITNKSIIKRRDG